ELPHIHAAQAAGCAPVVNAIRAGIEYPEPVKPDTIAKSIAIGNPADGYQVVQTVRSTGGTGAAVSDEQIVDAIRLLAETEGIFTEPAGGTTLAGTIELVQDRKSTRLNSSHVKISYAVFCLKKKNNFKRKPTGTFRTIR